MNKQELDVLSGQMPSLLTCLPDDEWMLSTPVQAYLNFYGINFTDEIVNIRHRFGALDTKKFRIAAHFWQPKNPVGTVVVVHGYYDHVGVFDHPIRYALTHNLAVLAFDLPGHGLSSGEQAVINSFDEYADVLASVMQQMKSFFVGPVYALGQSTGCAVILNYLWRYANVQNECTQFAKMALCSPLILARGWRGSGQYVYALLKHFLRKVARGKGHSSHDFTFNHFLQIDPLQSKFLSVRWVGAMKQWHQQFSAFQTLQTKLLVVQGTGDKTVDWQYNIPLIQQKLPQASVVYVEAAGHQLVNESEEYRAPVFAAIDNYFFNH
jgi:alpha-beta hydrolase superfamily lysophospholipase